MAEAAADFDDRVLQALATWEDSAPGHAHVSVEQVTSLLALPESDAGRVAKSLKRLIDSGFVDAIDVTAMGSPYPQYFVTGLSSAGAQAVRAIASRVRPGPDVANATEPSFMGVRRVDIRKNSRQIFVAYPYVIPSADYRSVYGRVGQRYGVQFVYADERLTNMHVLAKIYSMILESAFGIYDISGWNANVTLELGMALGLRETSYIVLNPTSHASTEAPADLRGFDRIEYRDYVELERSLEKLLAGLGLRRAE